ncbi:Dihydropteroate synthase 1 [Nocardioides dokdonensis FR1436]|uniref:Dihydropteroate synthase n=1 Tax=Nocardioides dokdonensis FR1436 TaxID=1300347 RepID=A0A1A9GK95_9ACTN|nr:dihydropteroate synthase [Nocardioides dokdonensis]ANH38100.1 Dihydropteroate synthase 1 [Nocardioides dokdonensis FR1436]
MIPAPAVPLGVPLGRPRVMGVVNVTPDSFSDGGRYAAPADAVAHGLALLDEGADLLDIGGESTRPGATRPLVAEELARVVPVIRELADAGAVVSVDTMRHEVAEAALEAGAVVVNDVSGGLADPAVLEVVAAAGATYVAMHWRAHSDRMRDFAVYDEAGGVVAAVCRELEERVEVIRAAGVADDRIVLDPGLGFAKTPAHSWALLRDLDPLLALGHPLLVGASRKSFLGSLLDSSRAGRGGPRPVGEREAAHLAVVLELARAGVWGVRVHDVRSARDALAVWAALTQEEGPHD